MDSSSSVALDPSEEVLSLVLHLVGTQGQYEPRDIYKSQYNSARLKEKESEKSEKEILKQRIAALEREKESANLEKSYLLLRLSRTEDRVSSLEEKLATVCAWVAKQTTAETTGKKTTNIFSRYFTTR